MALTKVSYSMIEGAVFNVLDYGADPTGVADSQPAIQAAVDEAVSAPYIAPYAAPYKTVFIPAGYYKMGAPLVIPAEPGGAMCAIVGEGNSFHCPNLIQAHAGHMIVLGDSSQAASPRIENIVIQGDKTNYPGNYHGIVQTTVGPASTAFQTLRNVMVRDMGGVGIYMDFAFYVTFHDVTVAYNKGGGMYIGGGAGNNMTVCTQNNLGYGIYFGAIGSLCQFFIEGDCIDNNPAGLNLSNYGLNIVGGSNRIGGNMLTNVNNNKTAIRVAGANNLISLVVDGSLVDPKVVFTAGANYNTITGNLSNSDSFYSGDATAIQTLICQGPAGSFKTLTTGERIITGGDSTVLDTAKGLHVGFDTTTNVAFIESTQPGTTNYELRLRGDLINLYGELGTSDSATSGLSTPATVNKKLPIYDNSGVLLGYIPIYTTL